MSWRHVGAVVLSVFLVLAGVAKAQEPGNQLIGVPVYDPVSKRYFAMMQSDTNAWMWLDVYRQARGRWYKGVQGRLAIVDTLEVHEFLLQHFRLKYFQDAWIGLRYLCKAHKLIWSDGQPYQPNGFEAWDKNWKQDIYFCNSGNGNPNEWAPIAYSPQFTWIGKGPSKGYQWYFMEYPTGHP